MNERPLETSLSRELNLDAREENATRRRDCGGLLLRVASTGMSEPADTKGRSDEEARSGGRCRDSNDAQRKN